MSHEHIPDQPCAICQSMEGDRYIHSRCHPAEPVWVKVTEDNQMVVQCSVCDQFIIRFQVQKIFGA